MAEPNSTNAYLTNRVMTARPEQLRMMLLEGALRFARQADEALGAMDFEKSFEGFGQCRAIILELTTSIRDEHDRDLADRVRALYQYIYQLLFEASFERDRSKLATAIELIEYETETWRLLLDKLAEERGTETANTAEPQGEPKPVSGFSVQA